MVSVIATLVFFAMLSHAFYTRHPARNDMALSLSVVFPKKDYVYICSRNLHYLDGVDASLASRIVVVPTMKALQFPITPNVKSYFPGFMALMGLPVHHSNVASFQIPATPIMEGIVDLHNDIMFFLTFIIVFVLYLLTVCLVQFSKGNVNYEYGYAGDNLSHNTAIEVI
jgi:hypothetical protein